MTNKESKKVSIKELEKVSAGVSRPLVKPLRRAELTRDQLKDVSAGRRAQAQSRRGAELTRDQLKQVSAGANRRQMLKVTSKPARRAQGHGPA